LIGAIRPDDRIISRINRHGAVLAGCTNGIARPALLGYYCVEPAWRTAGLPKNLALHLKLASKCDRIGNELPAGRQTNEHALPPYRSPTQDLCKGAVGSKCRAVPR
jgi:hypothetical protein